VAIYKEDGFLAICMRGFISIALLTIIGALVSCSELPKDQQDTSRRITETGVIRIGLMENPPWVIRTGEEPSGAEPILMREFANSLGAKPEWHWGSDEGLFGALELHELDAVVGGISNQTPWTKRIGITRYYFEEKFDVGVQQGDSIEKLDGVSVSVSDPRTAGFVRKENGTPVPIGRLSDSPGSPIAAADWKIRQMGLVPAGLDLHSDRHVIAVPPGENQLVKRLEEFLSARHDQIAVILAAQPEVIK
jgi:polar amino acid transport system substrate-binding protein